MKKTYVWLVLLFTACATTAVVDPMLTELDNRVRSLEVRQLRIESQQEDYLLWRSRYDSGLSMFMRQDSILMANNDIVSYIYYSIRFRPDTVVVYKDTLIIQDTSYIPVVNYVHDTMYVPQYIDTCFIDSLNIK